LVTHAIGMNLLCTRSDKLKKFLLWILLCQS
jgi:hypothetical protein